MPNPCDVLNFGTKTNSESHCRGRNRFPEKSHCKPKKTLGKTAPRANRWPILGHSQPSGHQPRLRTLQESLEGLSAALLVGDHLAVRLRSKGDTGDTLTRSNKLFMSTVCLNLVCLKEESTSGEDVSFFSIQFRRLQIQQVLSDVVLNDHTCLVMRYKHIQSCACLRCSCSQKRTSTKNETEETPAA